MKKNLLSIAASVIAVSFSQFASSAALTALCSSFNEEENETTTLKVTVGDDWTRALVTPTDADSHPGAIALKCNGPQSINEDFSCSVSMNAPGIGSLTMKFTRDTQNKMTLIADTEMIDENDSVVASTETFECTTV